jgi:carbon monoxide dehydrogenase subunit G
VRLESSFEVPAPPEQAWALLMDVPRIIPCMPGAKLEEAVGEATWKATMAVRLGPISLLFETDVKREEADQAARRARLSARAREARGRGNASAAIESLLTPHDGGTRVEIITDLQLAGAVSRYGRGLVEDVSSQLVAQFARCLEAQLAASPREARAAVEARSSPVGGLRLGLGASWRSLGRLLRRLRR